MLDIENEEEAMAHWNITIATTGTNTDTAAEDHGGGEIGKTSPSPPYAGN